MLLIFRPFKVGDFISVGGESGKVAEIGLFATDLDTLDNRRIIMPNGTIFGTVIENCTHHDIRRVDVNVGVEYGANLDQTRQTLLAGAQGVGKGLKDPPPQAVLVELGDSSVNWQVRVWCNTPDYWDVRDATTNAAKVALDNANITIPFPQVDVHMGATAQAAE